MEAIDRTVLYNQNAEDVVLGSIFMEPELIKECDLKAEEFSPGLNYRMFATFLDLDKKDIPIEPVSVAHRLGKHLEQVGGIARILELVNSVPSTRNFKRHCEIVREAYLRRRLIEVLEKKKSGALEGDVFDVIKEIQKEIESIEANTTTKIDGNIKNALKELAKKVENANGEHSGIYPGFKELQRLIYAYLKGQLIVTGARPSMGKTAFMNNSALNIAKSPLNPKGDVVGIFSLETKDVSLLERMAASVANIELRKLKTAAKDFTTDDWNKFQQAIGVLSSMDLEIFDEPRIGVDYIRRAIKETIKKYESEEPGRNYMFFIDYLQLIQGDPKLKHDRNLQVGEITRELKIMSGELGVTIHVLAQLNRGVESRQDKRPMMLDLRESGSIEQDADIIQFLYRDDYYNKESEQQDMLEVIVAKQRDGATGTAVLAFLKEYGKIMNVDWSQR